VTVRAKFPRRSGGGSRQFMGGSWLVSDPIVAVVEQYTLAKTELNWWQEAMVARLCNARLCSGGFCRKPARPGGLRCHLHGSAGGRPHGTSGHVNSRVARLEGRRRWVERMRAAKAAGQIDRFPNGRRARGLPLRSKDPIISRGQQLIERAIAMAKA